MSRGPDAATLLERALLASAARCGVSASVVSADWQRWASATFVGGQHQIVLECEAAGAADAWLAALADAELALRGHLVADLSVQAVARDQGRVTARIEALTVESR